MGKIAYSLVHNQESTQEKSILQGQEKLEQSSDFIRCEWTELQVITW